MKNALILSMALTALALSTSAQAGSWSYSCMGRVSGDRTLILDQTRLVLMPSEYIPIRADGMVQTAMTTYQPQDASSGVTKVGSELLYDCGKSGEAFTLSLMVKKVQTLSEKTKKASCGRYRAREITDTRMRVKFELKEFPGATPEAIELDCLEHWVSTCG